MPMPKGYKEKKIYCSPEEWETICKRANELHMRTGTYIRKIAVDGEIKNYDREAIMKLVVAINRYGNNINQIAMVVNSSQNIYKVDVDNLQNNFIQLKSKFDCFLHELKGKLK